MLEMAHGLIIRQVAEGTVIRCDETGQEATVTANHGVRRGREFFLTWGAYKALAEHPDVTLVPASPNPTPGSEEP